MKLREHAAISAGITILTKLPSLFDFYPVARSGAEAHFLHHYSLHTDRAGVQPAGISSFGLVGATQCSIHATQAKLAQPQMLSGVSLGPVQT